jgi:uncharacterized membrane protein (DUF106 family)
MLETLLAPNELATIFIIAFVAVVIFTVCIAFLVQQSRMAAYYKKVAEDNAKAFKQLQQADKVLLTPVSDIDFTNRLRSGKF